MSHIGTSYTKGAGYFVNDKDLRSRQEADVQTCSHCQAVIKMQEWKSDGAWCGRCMKPICVPCGARAAVWGCEPFLKRLEQHAEHQMRFARLLTDAGLNEPVTPRPIITGSR